MTEPNWEGVPNAETPPPSTDAPPVTAIPDVAGAAAAAPAAETINPDAPTVKRGRGRPPLTDAQKEARKAANATKARAKRAAKPAAPAKASASNGVKRGRPASVRSTAAPASTSDNPILDAIRADAAKLRDKIFAAIISGTL